MDKVKIFFAKFKKHHFWVLTAIIFLLSLSMWYSATEDLAAQTDTNKKKVKAQFNALHSIVNKTQHPNEKFAEQTKLLETNLRRDVDKAWTRVYSDQKSKVLKWPSELGEDFLDWVDDPDNHQADIPEDFREVYWNYVKNEFPNLLKIVDARHYLDKSEGEAGGGIRSREIELEGPVQKKSLAQTKDYKVIWDVKNQQMIDSSLEFPKGMPNSTQVRYCQENLWVYNALLDAIADINEGAPGHHNARVKEIIGIHVGQDASAIVKESLASGRIMTPEGAMAQSGAPRILSEEGEMPMTRSPGIMMEGRDAPEMGGAGTGAGNTLDDMRYVDETGVPMPAGTIGPAEFKRMPISMRLFMDQREVAHLLVRLANSPLPVEIRQLRINTKLPGFTNPRQFFFGAGGTGSQGRTAQIRRDKAFEDAAQYPYDIGVELHGIIYIFNPPSPKLLAEVQSVEGETAGSGAPVERVEENVPPEDAASAEESAGPATTPQEEAGDAEQRDPEKAESDGPDQGSAQTAPAEVPMEEGSATGAPTEEQPAKDAEGTDQPNAKSEEDSPASENEQS